MNTLRPLPLLLRSRGVQAVWGGASAGSSSSSSNLFLRAAGTSAPAGVFGRIATPGGRVVASTRYSSSMAAAAEEAQIRQQQQPPQQEAEASQETETAKDKEYRPRSVPPPGHGERIWVFFNRETNQTVYSLSPTLKATKAMRQILFTGKKLKPSKFRRDYWWPLLLIEFGAGKGDVGRSAYHKLRELQKRHLLEWAQLPDERQRLHKLKRQGDRGKELIDQRGNTVADIAAVLAGRGKGNLAAPKARLEGVVEVEVPAEPAAETAETAAEATAAEGAAAPLKAVKLHEARVFWTNEQDKYYVENWTVNVQHVVGLPELDPEVKKALGTKGLNLLE
ncbi:hypothetical protein VTJ83DRAFT_2617 [Remersonia thermophila]|uniref:Large ribosomal subunit protein mL67 n=1 Tax=Remersonia thermophila TaxID=72144 RepID=A0ABR4DJ84_9PEZI